MSVHCECISDIVKSEGLDHITDKSVCHVCKSNRVEVKYILNKKLLKYAKPQSYGFYLLEDDA